MDIRVSAELILRSAGYETRALSDGKVICFENETILGFIHTFSTAESLLSEWEALQKSTLTRFANSLREAPEKAWNLYTVLLTSDFKSDKCHQIDQIEEDFSYSRKIARMAIQSEADLRKALLHILPLSIQSHFEQDDFQERLRARVADLSAEAIRAFLGDARPDDVAQILRERQ